MAAVGAFRLFRESVSTRAAAGKYASLIGFSVGFLLRARRTRKREVREPDCQKRKDQTQLGRTG